MNFKCLVRVAGLAAQAALRDLIHNLQPFPGLFFALAPALNTSCWNSGQDGTPCPSATPITHAHTPTHTHTLQKA